MFNLYSSNYLECLLAELVALIERGDKDPFVPETIVVQNPGMSRWLSQQIALRQGISANLEFSTPGRFLWDVARRWFTDLPPQPGRDKVRLTWQVFSLLPELLAQPSFRELGHYLRSDESGLQRLQLAQRIAGVFDQYLVYRPDLVLQWERGASDHWQALLWRAVSEALPAEHWGSVKHRFASVADRAPALPVPDRISVFGVSDMPPLYTELLQIVARHSDIHFFYLNPCREYWADIVDERQQSRRRARARQSGQKDTTGLLDVGNPLLASWGHAGQSFLDQLLDIDVQSIDTFIDPGTTADGNDVPVDQQTLLHRLQSDVLELQDSRTDTRQLGSTSESDLSLQVHSVHSRWREVQVLHDQLLRMFQQHPALQPRDIIVMAPDIDRYAPFIDATFSTASNEQYIPWSISDRRLRTEQHVLEALAGLLDLPNSRFESTELLALLDIPAICRRFSIDSNGLRLIRQWVSESGVRWSLDASMRTEFGLPADNANSWRFGLQRVFLGFAMEDMEGELYQGIAPYPDIEGSQSTALEVLQQLIDLCAGWRHRLRAEHTVQRWMEELDQLIAAFFVPDESEAQALQVVREKLHELIAHANAVNLQRPLSREVVAELLHSILEDSSSIRQFLTGRVTFSNMVPMRSIPFKVVCVIGLNTEDFPRNDRPMSFDLIASEPRRGDRYRRDDDRYLFLETLLSARDVLYLSYIGRDIRDNSAKAPSTVLTELIDYSGVSVTEHPLQPFSSRYFDQSDRSLVSYKAQWLEAARSQPAAENPEFAGNTLRQLDDSWRITGMQELISFYQLPAAEFLSTRLDIRFTRAEDSLENTEPFEVDNLHNWQLKQAVYGFIEKGDTKALIKDKLKARGELPAGVAGDSILDAVFDTTSSLDLRASKYKNRETTKREVDIDLGDFRLTGYLEGVGQNGLFDAWVGGLRAKDLVRTWIRHVVLCRLAPSDVALKSVLVCEPFTAKFSPVENPGALLQDLLDMRWQGLATPLVWFPDAALAWLNSELAVIGTKDAPRWHRRKTAESELKKIAPSVLWRGHENPFGEDFKSTSRRVLMPLFEHVKFLTSGEDV